MISNTRPSRQKKTTNNEDISSCIKVGKFEFKTRSFWLSVLGFLLIFWLGLSGIIAYTVYKISDNYKEIIVQKMLKEKCSSFIKK